MQQACHRWPLWWRPRLTGPWGAPTLCDRPVRPPVDRHPSVSQWLSLAPQFSSSQRTDGRRQGRDHVPARRTPPLRAHRDHRDGRSGDRTRGPRPGQCRLGAVHLRLVSGGQRSADVPGTGALVNAWWMRYTIATLDVTLISVGVGIMARDAIALLYFAVIVPYSFDRGRSPLLHRGDVGARLHRRAGCRAHPRPRRPGCT